MRMGPPLRADSATIECKTFVPGMFVTLLYMPPTDGSRLKLNITNGEDHLLCVNPRYDENSLVLNSKLDGGWQHQECPDGFLQERTTQTLMVVSAEEDTFGIYADKGRHKYSYQYRDEVTKVKHIEYIGNGTGAHITIGRVLLDFGVGKTVNIHSCAPPKCDLGIEFIPSVPSNFKPEDRFFAMSIRFNENVVIRNNRRDGHWGMEEKAGGMPFCPGKPFVVTVVTQKDKFEISVDGSHFTHFRYRTALPYDMSVQLCGVTYVEKIEYC